MYAYIIKQKKLTRKFIKRNSFLEFSFSFKLITEQIIYYGFVFFIHIVHNMPISAAVCDFSTLMYLKMAFNSTEPWSITQPAKIK